MNLAPLGISSWQCVSEPHDAQVSFTFAVWIKASTQSLKSKHWKTTMKCSVFTFFANQEHNHSDDDGSKKKSSNCSDDENVNQLPCWAENKTVTTWTDEAGKRRITSMCQPDKDPVCRHCMFVHPAAVVVVVNINSYPYSYIITVSTLVYSLFSSMSMCWFVAQ